MRSVGHGQLRTGSDERTDPLVSGGAPPIDIYRDYQCYLCYLLPDATRPPKCSDVLFKETAFHVHQIPLAPTGLPQHKSVQNDLNDTTTASPVRVNTERLADRTIFQL